MPPVYPGPDGPGFMPTSGGLEGAPKPSQARSWSAGSVGFPIAFVKPAKTIKISQVPIKLKIQTTRKNKFKKDNSPSYKGLGTASEAPAPSA